MDRAREIAARIQAGERAALRRWLSRPGLWAEKPVTLWGMGMEDLENAVEVLNGDPEKIKTEGRKRVVDLLTQGQ